MLKTIRNSIRSFSFRAGFLIFIALCTVLTTLRVHLYFESVNRAYADVRALVSAHAEELDKAMRAYGPTYVAGVVNDMLEDAHDASLVLFFRSHDTAGGEHIVGNLAVMPVLDASLPWQEIVLQKKQGQRANHVLIMQKPYPAQRSLLLVGYDLARIEAIRSTISGVLVVNVLLSFVLSLVLSTGIVWLINRHFRKVSRTVDSVIHGNLAERVPLSNSGDTFDQLGQNINRMLDWVNVLLETVRDSSNSLAHDMRTPLSRHRLELSAIAKNPGITDEVRGEIEHAVEQVDSLVEMFDNILNISRAESRTAAELFSRFDVAALVRDVAEFYDALFEERRQQLVLDIPEGEHMILGDKQLVSQALMNLVDNASKYTQAGGQISVGLETEEHFGRGAGTVRVIVADNGPGIPPELREKVKERFFRGDKSRHSKGVGLGLSLVNAVAHLHHGALVLEDNRPGTRITLVLSQK